MVALSLKKALGIPWIAHFSDPWYGGPYWDAGAVRTRIIRRFERKVLQSADGAVFVSEETRDLTMSRYPPEWKRKTHVIPHCFDVDLYPRESTKHDGIVFRHIGSFYGPRSPICLLDAIRRLKETNHTVLEGVCFELVGGAEDGVASEVERRGLSEFVRIRPEIDFLQSLCEMKSADVLILVEAPATTNLYLPSKLIDYLGAARPILALSPSRGPAARILTDPRDRIVPPDDVVGIATAIRDFIAQSRKGELRDFRRPADLLDRFDCRSTAARLASLFDETIRVCASSARKDS